jgi:hypothetical protein
MFWWLLIHWKIVLLGVFLSQGLIWLSGFLSGLWWANLMERTDKRKLLLADCLEGPNGKIEPYVPPPILEAFKPKPRLTIVRRRTHEGV